ncbi:MAG: PfkB family carbohydrate kinase [Candidatus Limnocylindrales bacterium]
MAKSYDITFVGHMCYDEIIPFGGEPRIAPGSAVLCGAMVAARVGKRVAAVVKMARKDEHILLPMKEAGVDTYLIPSNETTYSRVVHESENVDERRLILVKSAGLISISDVPPLQTRCAHLAGISDTEFDMALMQGLKSRGYSLSVDLQSFVRHVTPSREIEFSDVANKRDIVSMMDKVKLDVVEARILTGTDDLEKASVIIEGWGCPEIVITHSPGVLARVNGKTLYEKFSNKSTVGRTGRGDTTFAAYLSYRLEHGPAESLRFAAALVSIKMETPGPFKGTLEDVTRRLHEEHSS